MEKIKTPGQRVPQQAQACITGTSASRTTCEVFLSEMDKGLAGRKSSLAMLPTYIDIERELPRDKPVIVMDAGGTNFRVATVTFAPDGPAEITDFKVYPMPGIAAEVGKEEFFGTMAAYVRSASTAEPERRILLLLSDRDVPDQGRPGPVLLQGDQGPRGRRPDDRREHGPGPDAAGHPGAQALRAAQRYGRDPAGRPGRDQRPPLRQLHRLHPRHRHEHRLRRAEHEDRARPRTWTRRRARSSTSNRAGSARPRAAGSTRRSTPPPSAPA